LTPLDADAGRLQALATAEARVLGLADEQALVAAGVVQGVLSHDLLRRAREAQGRMACRRETPVTTVWDDGALVEGVVDLAFEEGGRWTVIDYKTDRELDADSEDRYRRQVAFYAGAIARSTGQPASGVIMRV
jgi:ATP-dependent exoDNAse (exonuclease V) beta subunit